MAEARRGLRIALFGPPGVGKGTQAAEIVKRTGVALVSTGNMLREAMREDTPLGRKVCSVVDRGDLVPDDLVGELVATRLGRDEARRGFLLDGYPRTVAQALFLDAFLEARGEALDAVVNLDVPEAEILDRLTGRRVCGECGATYHALNNRPRVEGRCDACGEALAQRPDDAPNTVTERLRVYAERTAPVLDHFRAAGLLVRVDGTGAVAEVLERIARAVPGILG